MKTLPVPPLQQTMQHFLVAVRPLVSEGDFRQTEAQVAAFLGHDGPRCQAALTEFAAAEAAQGRSWLARPWFDSYWAEREPLPLTSSTAVHAAWSSPGTPAAGVPRAAHIARRVAEVHLQHLRGELEPELGFSGEPLSATQRSYLAGGIREPGSRCDTFTPGPTHPESREIGVIWRGRLLAVPISDERGRVVSQSALETALERITALDAMRGVSPLAPSYLGSARLADVLEDLLADPVNRGIYDRLARMLLMINLCDQPLDTAGHLELANFGVDQAWAYKPASYQIGLSDGFVGVHMEHSTYDGASCLATLAAAQRVQLPPGSSSSAALPVASLQWRMSPTLRDHLREGVSAYRRRAEHYRLRLVRAETPGTLQQRISHDGCMQLAMLYAQLRCYGRLRSTYEAVDMREYAAGRTECLRPNSREAVALAVAMVAGTATPAQLHDALDAHRAAVKRAKSGHAIDRHLFGLRLMATQLDLAPALFAGEGYRRLTSDFLSTTSVGSPEVIRQVSFAPVVDDGIGIYYVADGGGYEFLLSWRDDRAERIDEFASALVDGATAVWRLAVALDRELGG